MYIYIYIYIYTWVVGLRELGLGECGLWGPTAFGLWASGAMLNLLTESVLHHVGFQLPLPGRSPYPRTDGLGVGFLRHRRDTQ